MCYYILKNPLVYFFGNDEKRGKIGLLLIQKDQKLYLVEIEKHMIPAANDVSAFKISSKIEPIERGCKICLTSETRPLSKKRRYDFRGSI